MKLVLSTLFLCLSLSFIGAQVLSPVKWSFDSESQGNGIYKVSFTADIEKGWAIYSQFTADGGPIPTSFTFDPNSNISLIDSVMEPDEKEKKFDELFELEVIKIKGKPEFYQIVKSSTENSVLSGYLTYMVCDDSKCLPPEDITFEIPIE